MVMVHPGQQVRLGRGPRLLVEVSSQHADAVALALDPADGLTLAAHRQGRWVLEGPAGSSGRLVVVAADRRVMTDVMTLTLSLPGASPAVAEAWGLGDIPVDGRDRVALLSVTRDGETWGITSLIPPRPRTPTERTIRGARPTEPVINEPVTLDVAVAVDRSASMGWAIDNGTVTEVAKGLSWAGRRALTADSSLSWCSYGSGRDETDPVHILDLSDRIPDDFATLLRGGLPSSGARLDEVVPRIPGCDVLVAVTDLIPDPAAIEACAAAGVRLAVVLVGVPVDRADWPVDWQEQAARCEADGVRVLPVGERASVLPATRDWGMQLLSASADAEGQEARR